MNTNITKIPPGFLAATKAPKSESPSAAFTEICSELKRIQELLDKPL